MITGSQASPASPGGWVTHVRSGGEVPRPATVEILNATGDILASYHEFNDLEDNPSF